MGWRPVLHTRASTASAKRTGGGSVEQVGWIVAWPDVCFPDIDVELFPSGELKRVYMAWADRPTLFDGFVRHCFDVARYSVNLRNDVIQRFTLWVEETALSANLFTYGILPGEVELLCVLRHLATEGQLSDNLKSFQLPDAISQTQLVSGHWEELKHALHERGWPTSLPPFFGQLKSIAWLRSIEKAVIDEEDIQYEVGIPLGMSGWSYRVTQDQMRPREHSGMGKARFRGGCCCDAVGTGKTASALGLILLSPSTQPTEKDGIRLRTRATLVIVPVNLPQQWHEEAAKFAPQLSVVMLLNAKDVKGLTIASLLSADIVITTFSTLRGKPYLDVLEEYTRSILRCMA